MVVKQLARRLTDAHESHYRIARGAFLAVIFVAVAKLGAAAREIAIAWRYGTSDVVDAFQLSVTITTWLPMLIAGTSTGLLVPRLVAVRRDPQANALFVSELNAAVLLTASLTLLLTALATIPAVQLIGHGLSPQTQQWTKQFTFLMLPVGFLTIVAAYFYVRLQAAERQIFALTEAIPPLLVVLLILMASSRAQSLPLLAGMTVGTFAC